MPLVGGLPLQEAQLQEEDSMRFPASRPFWGGVHAAGGASSRLRQPVSRRPRVLDEIGLQSIIEHRMGTRIVEGCTREEIGKKSYENDSPPVLRAQHTTLLLLVAAFLAASGTGVSSRTTETDSRGP